MKYNYTVEVTVGDQVTQKNTYKNVEEAMNAAKKSALDYANTLRVHDYISRIREGINKGYRALVADYWAEFFSSPTFNVMTREAPFEEDPEYYEEKIEEVESDWDDEDYAYEEPPKDPLDDFYCDYKEFDITEFYFGRKLHMETNWFRIPEGRYYDGWISALESEGFDQGDRQVFDMRTLDHHIVVTVSRLTNTTHSENIVFVYRTLTDSPQSREVIRNYIWKNYKADLSPKTIGSHLDTLRKLGVPVAHRGKNKYTSDRKHGYYLDNEMHCDVSREEVATLGTSVNCLLVLLALKDLSGPVRQADIIRWIEEHYGVKIGRAAVSRQIDSLRDMRYNIEQTKDGYVLKE